MNKSSILLKISIGLMAVGIACWVTFNIIGTKIAADGTMQEPFALLPIGLFFIILGGITAATQQICHRTKICASLKN